MSFLSMNNTQLECQTSTTIPNGECGGCGSPAINAFETICSDCCKDLGLSAFPYYTYPSELMYSNLDSKAKRTFYIRGHM